MWTWSILVRDSGFQQGIYIRVCIGQPVMCVLGSGMCFGMKDKSHGCILIANIYSRLFSHVTPGYFVYQRLCNLHTASCFWFAMDLSLEYGHTAVLPSTRSSQQHQNQIWIRLNDNPLVTDIGSPCSRTYWQPPTSIVHLLCWWDTELHNNIQYDPLPA